MQDLPFAGDVHLKAPLSVGLVTEPNAGSAKDTLAVRAGCDFSTSGALFPSTQVSAWESRSKYESSSCLSGRRWVCEIVTVIELIVDQPRLVVLTLVFFPGLAESTDSE